MPSLPRRGGEGAAVAVRRGVPSETLAHHLLPLGPPGRASIRIQRVPLHAAANGRVIDPLCHVTILAIEAAHLVRRRHDACPDRGRRTLRNGLEAEGRLARR